MSKIWLKLDVTIGNLIWLDLIGFATALVGSCSQFQGSHKFTQSFDIFLCYSVTFHVPQFYIQLYTIARYNKLILQNVLPSVFFYFLIKLFYQIYTILHIMPNSCVGTLYVPVFTTIHVSKKKSRRNKTKKVSRCPEKWTNNRNTDLTFSSYQSGTCAVAAR